MIILKYSLKGFIFAWIKKSQLILTWTYLQCLKFTVRRFICTTIYNVCNIHIFNKQYFADIAKISTTQIQSTLQYMTSMINYHRLLLSFLRTICSLRLLWIWTVKEGPRKWCWLHLQAMYMCLITVAPPDQAGLNLSTVFMGRYVYVFDHSGTPRSGWPKSINSIHGQVCISSPGDQNLVSRLFQGTQKTK